MPQAYGIRTTVKTSYEETIPRVTDALTQEGFGILTQIDVKETLKKKLNVDFTKYVILGACNPQLAYKSLSSETEIGLLLPCNVIVYEGKDGQTVVAAQDPAAALGIVGNPALVPVANEARERLARVIDALKK